MKHILSLGAGVQSSTVEKLASHGLITPMPTCGLFADTGDEPDEVYKWLSWIESTSAFPIIRVSIGRLSLAATTPRPSRSQKHYLKPAIPVFFKGEDSGKGKRTCTMDFKITPIERYANLIRGGEKVTMWMGISTDEAHRMHTAVKPWIVNRYPLIELGMSRSDCIQWMKDHGYPEPPRSSCRYCPFHSDDEWLRLKSQHPRDFAKAVEFERQYQDASKLVFKSVPYLHKSRVPLDQVEFVPGAGRDQFGNECQGMCGV